MHNPHRARVLWDKWQNFFSAFFTEIGNIRKEIGNDREFAKWCFNDLHIPVATIARVADVLARVDAEKTKHELAVVRAAERSQKGKEREVKRASKPPTVKQSPADTALIARQACEIEQLKERLVAAELRAKQAPKAQPVNTQVNTKPDRSRDRHSPNYMRDYMRQRRATQKEGGQ
jgi:hypothetical protein